MAERKKRKTPGTVKKKATGTKPKAAAERVTRRGGPDRTFGKVLRSKSLDAILPEVSNRLEAGRRLYAKDAVPAATAELAVLNRERKRLAEEGEVEGSSLVRIERLVAAVETDIGAGRALLDEMKRTISPERGGWSVVGRVSLRDGTIPKKAEVVFLDENHEPIKELRAVKAGTDGTVRQAFSANVVKRLQAKGVKVTAAVQVGGRIVATDPTPVSLKSGAMHQFDFRINTGLE